MGLDLDMFQDAVPEDLVCALCRKVVVNPVHGGHCLHLFCRACLQRSDVKATCLTCGVKVKAKVKDASVSEPSVEDKVRLLGLTVHCSHRCGQTCTLAELPDHVAEDCPNAPVSCPHVQRGCKMTVKRKEVREHSEECDYRQVQCEACGQTTLFMDLFTHQSRKRCLEKKLRQQLIKAVKITTTEVKLHRRHLERQSLRLERQQRQRLLDHRQTAVLAVKPQRHYHHPHHHNNHTNTTRSAKIEGGGSGGGDNTTTTTTNNNNNNSCNGSELEARSVVSTEVSSIEPQHRPPRDVFLTSANTCDEEGEGEKEGEREREEEVSEKSTTLLTRTSPSPSRLSGSSAVAPTCRNCKRHFRENLNAPNACRWHPGPIIELFGGTCYSCGRLDYQKGCMMGYHEL